MRRSRALTNLTIRHLLASNGADYHDILDKHARVLATCAFLGARAADSASVEIDEWGVSPAQWKNLARLGVLAVVVLHENLAPLLFRFGMLDACCRLLDHPSFIGFVGRTGWLYGPASRLEVNV